MKAMLLRVGIDKGVWRGRVPDGAYGPIFEDGTFEFVPKSEESRVSLSKGNSIKWGSARTYENTICRSGKTLSTYLPEKDFNKYPFQI